MGEVENKLTKKIIEYLNSTGITVWRQNNLSVKGRTFTGRKGIADISGIMPNGIRVEIEIKDMGKTPSIDQLEFEKMIKKNKGIYIWCDSWDVFMSKWNNGTNKGNI